ncbi:MAG: DNA polymerase III subunit delta' [Pseudomonadota bacterium]
MMEMEERIVADRLEGVPLPAETTAVLGHDDALLHLKKAYGSGRMHHGWLLAGPRGIGKSATAFSMARHILSHPNPATAPGDHGPAAVDPSVSAQIANGAHPNLLHLTRPWDAKAKRFKTKLTVDEIRQMHRFFGLTAGAGGWRICIVDAADDLNPNSANALLKMLEEPPKRTIIFVITHVVGGLLATIRSRCQVLNFKPLNAQHIDAITEKFDLVQDDVNRSRAAGLADGSVRKAIQLLQGGALEPYSAFEKLMQARATGTAQEWMVVHKIAEQLSGAGKDETFRLFMDLAMGWIGNQVREAPAATPATLAGWAEVWDKATRSLTLAEAFNLDKKQVILSLFYTLFERHKT